MLVVVATAGAFGCSKAPAKPGPLVAKGKDMAVTVGEFKARLDEQSPAVRARYATLDRKKEFLENLIRFELLAAEARRRKLDQDPEVQAAIQRLLVQKLVRAALDEKGGSGAASEAEARAHYDAHLAEFVRPERVRVSLLLLRAEPGSPIRAAKVAELKKRLAQLKVDEQRSPLAFGNLARDLSDDAASRAAGGDLGFRSREELERQYAAPVAEAAFALKDIGALSGVVEGPAGIYLIKLGGRQAASSTAFEETKGQLMARLGREQRTKEFDEFVKTLRMDADVQVVDAELEKVAIDGGDGSRPAGQGPAQGSPAR